MKEAIGFLKIEFFYFHINAAYARTWLSLFNFSTKYAKQRHINIFDILL